MSGHNESVRLAVTSHMSHVTGCCDTNYSRHTHREHCTQPKRPKILSNIFVSFPPRMDPCERLWDRVNAMVILLFPHTHTFTLKMKSVSIPRKISIQLVYIHTRLAVWPIRGPKCFTSGFVECFPAFRESSSSRTQGASLIAQ